MKYLIDLDGTLLNGTEVVDGALEFISYLQREQINFLIMTNSIKSPTLVSKRLSNVGVEVSPQLILNPITAINNYLVNNNITSAYVVGSPLEIQQVITPHNGETPEIIILLDFEKESYGYDKLQEIFEFICRGLPVITASKSPFYLSGERKKLDTGAFVALLESTGLCSIEVFGKPSISYFTQGVNMLSADKSEITVIGDDITTDIKGAMDTGINAILVQTGKYNKGDEVILPQVRCVKSLLECIAI